MKVWSFHPVFIIIFMNPHQDPQDQDHQACLANNNRMKEDERNMIRPSQSCHL
jgi:hypothetical protein